MSETLHKSSFMLHYREQRKEITPLAINRTNLAQPTHTDI